MKAIVHIGSPKAGSSSIQNFLYLNRGELARRGFRFHRNVRGRGSQFEYPMAALTRAGLELATEDQRVRYHARNLAEQRRSCEPHAEALKTWPTRWKEPVALFSSEHILPWLKSPETIEIFDAMFRDVFEEVRYIAYFRSPFDLVVSQYSERIKRGLTTETLDEFVARRADGPRMFRPARKWRQTVGAERLDVRLLERDFLHGGDLIEDFCHACGIDPAGLERPPRVNEKLSAPAAEALRILNAQVPDMLPGGGANPLRAGIVKHLMELSRGGPPLRLSRAQYDSIDRAVGEACGKFRRQFFPERAALFSSRPPDGPPPDTAALREEALSLMAELLVRARLGELRELGRIERRRAVAHRIRPPGPQAAPDPSPPSQSETAAAPAHEARN